MRIHRYRVYILANANRTLYIGMTSELERRILQHKQKAFPGFTAQYGVDQLVYVEEFSNVHQAIAREKQLKKWVRAKKVVLIEAQNPHWQDLAANWFQKQP